MKFNLTIVASLFLLPLVGAQTNQLISETYIVPLPEEDVFTKTFSVMNSVARAPVTSVISLSISADNTIVYVDHWEDGYEVDLLNPKQRTTQIWGDGNATNGCVHGRVCTDRNDILKAGDAIVMENMIPIPRVRTNILFDGGDLFASTFPIAVTRGSYPFHPGSLMAGAVEVLEYKSWGTSYEAPVGQNIVHVTQAYEYSALYIMAGNDQTTVVIGGTTTLTLNKGQTTIHRVNQGQNVTSNKPIQVYLLTGDIGSTYELRFFTLWPVSAWSNEYVSPMGDTIGNTQIVLYNPNRFWINVTVEQRGGVRTLYSVPSRGSRNTDNIPYGSGAYLTSTNTFVALSQTDSALYDGRGGFTVGQAYDWGYTVLSRDLLASQVLIGWGYGCTFKNCTGGSRSVVFLTPMDAADVYIDFNNDGVIDRTITAVKLESLVITDTDNDMSGAIIYATARGSGRLGTPVDIAAAWGQNPATAQGGDINAMDLGTTVLPFPSVRAYKAVQLLTDLNNDGLIGPGDTVTYSIHLVNMGQRDVAAGTVQIVDPGLSQMTYVPNSCKFVNGSDTSSQSIRPVTDDTVGTPFPLDGRGISNPFILPRRGGHQYVSFNAVVAPASQLNSTTLVNSGYVDQGAAAPLLPFSVSTPIAFAAAVDIEKTVYIGYDSKKSCGTALEQVSGPIGTAITYCFKVTNTGNSLLKINSITDAAIPYSTNAVGQLAPGDSVVLAFESTIIKTLTSSATVTGTPILSNWALIGIPDVTDTDDAGVNLVVYNPSVSIVKTVYTGDNGVNGCGAGVKSLTGNYLATVTYCFRVTNTGTEHLNQVTVTDSMLGFTDSTIGKLAPGASAVVVTTVPLTTDLTSTAKVTGNPTDAAGFDIPSLADVSATDTAGVKVVYIPSISLSKTVYLGDSGTDECSTAVESVTATYGSKCTYCYKITNTGNSWLSTVTLADADVTYKNDNVATLAPGDSTVVSFLSSITVPIKSMATVIATPAFKTGGAIPSLTPVMAKDDAGVIPIYNPKVEIRKYVKLGVQDAFHCQVNGKELVIAPKNSDVTYCYHVINKGDSVLNQITVDDKLLGYHNTTLKPLKPGEEGWLAFPTKLTADLTSLAVVTANPCLANFQDIPNIPNVTSSDTAGVQIQYNPAIVLEKKVKLGHFGPDGCEDGLESVTGNVGAYCTYCYIVTNIGSTPLSSITVSDPLPFTGPVTPLAPGESTTIVYQTTITKSTTTNGTAIGYPTDESGKPLVNYGPVNSTDSAGVVATILQLAMEAPTNCLQPAYTDVGTGNTDTLHCTKVEVHIVPGSLVPDTPTTCEDGTDVILSLKGAILVPSSRYDIGWYVATDGGDALTGTCALSVLDSSHTYAVKDRDDHAAGSVAFNLDKIGGNDDCGDVLVTSINGSPGLIPIHVVTDQSLKCVDTTGDGNLDVSICFSWRDEKTDGLCNYRPDDPNKQGSFPDVYPGSPLQCFCSTYEVSGVKVITLIPEDNSVPC